MSETAKYDLFENVTHMQHKNTHILQSYPKTLKTAFMDVFKTAIFGVHILHDIKVNSFLIIFF